MLSSLSITEQIRRATSGENPRKRETTDYAPNERFRRTWSLAVVHLEEALREVPRGHHGAVLGHEVGVIEPQERIQ